MGSLNRGYRVSQIKPLKKRRCRECSSDSDSDSDSPDVEIVIDRPQTTLVALIESEFIKLPLHYSLCLNTMSLIPWNGNDTTNTDTDTTLDTWTPFPRPRHMWDQLSSFLFTAPSPTLPLPYSSSQLGVETSGSVSAKVECREVEEAHLVVAHLSGLQKHHIHVSTQDGRILRITGEGEGGNRFHCHMRMPPDANVGMFSWSMENGVLTVVIPKLGLNYFLQGWGWENSGPTNRRQIQIEGSG